MNKEILKNLIAIISFSILSGLFIYGVYVGLTVINNIFGNRSNKL